MLRVYGRSLRRLGTSHSVPTCRASPSNPAPSIRRSTCVAGGRPRAANAPAGPAPSVNICQPTCSRATTLGRSKISVYLRTRSSSQVRAQANPNRVHASSTTAPGTAHHASRHAAQTRVPQHLDSCPSATYSWELLCGYALGCAGACECHTRNREIEVNSITFCLCRLGTSHGTSTRKTNPLGSHTKTVVVAAHFLLQTGGYGRPTRQLQVSTSDHPLIIDQFEYVGCALYAAYVPGSFRTAYTQSRRRRHRHISCSAMPQRHAFPGIAIRVLPIHTRGNAARLPFAHIYPLCVLFFNIQLSTSPPLHLSLTTLHYYESCSCYGEQRLPWRAQVADGGYARSLW
jgi:hypothetical protein